MPRKFRVTCARTSYFELELQAEDASSAERLAAQALEAQTESGAPLGRPVHRIVDVAPAQERQDSGSLPKAAA